MRPPAPRRRLWSVVVASSVLVLALAACGGDDDGSDEGGGGDGAGGGTGKVTRQQWESVGLDATKDEVLGEFGEPQNEAEYEGLTYTASYAGDAMYGGDVDATVGFTFDPDSGEFKSKSWLESVEAHATIDASLFAKVSNGMTQDQVESILGQPGIIEDEITTLSLGPPAQFVEPGVLEQCISYEWRNSDFAGSVCFDESGKAIGKDHSTANPAPVPPKSG